MRHPDEVGVTNLGDVPAGLTFLEATIAARSQRKYRVNPQHYSARLTICETARELYRRAGGLAEPERTAFQELAAQAFDMGKRMNARMVKLREHR